MMATWTQRRTFVILVAFLGQLGTIRSQEEEEFEGGELSFVVQGCLPAGLEGKRSGSSGCTALGVNVCVCAEERGIENRGAPLETEQKTSRRWIKKLQSSLSVHCCVQPEVRKNNEKKRNLWHFWE